MDIKYKYEIKQTEKISSDKIIQLILKDRSVKNISEFLSPPPPTTIRLSEFCSKKNIDRTVKLLEKIKKEKRKIIVYTDYDADGITGGAILWETLYLLGFDALPYVPHRIHEGYGFSKKGIDTIKKEYDPALIISVDHGITAKEKISYAKKLGIDVVVTDHHLKPENIPDKAVAIFHIPALSGSGVAYVFAKMIFDAFFSVQTRHAASLQNYFQTDYTALAAIGTVADLVPLIGPSRSIVKHGLAAFQKTKRVGIKAILQEAGIDAKPITPYEVGYVIAPRINALGRLEHAIDALRLLCTKDHTKAHMLAKKLGCINRDRQELLDKSVEEARLRLKASEGEQKKSISTSFNEFQRVSTNFQLPKIIVLVSTTWHEGIIGLIASKIAEAFYRPTIVITKTKGFYKGSARSFPFFHITDFLREHKKYLIDIGGHAAAAGFTIEEKNLNDFVTIAHKSSQKLIKDKDLQRIYRVDIKIPLSKITLDLAHKIETLEPFGVGNPKPTFFSTGELVDAKVIGKTAKHLKLYIDDMEFVSFNSADQFSKLSKGQEMEIMYQIEVNRWNGKEKVCGKLSIFPVEI